MEFLTQELSPIEELNYQSVAYSCLPKHQPPPPHEDEDEVSRGGLNKCKTKSLACLYAFLAMVHKLLDNLVNLYGENGVKNDKKHLRNSNKKFIRVSMELFLLFHQLFFFSFSTLFSVQTHKRVFCWRSSHTHVWTHSAQTMVMMTEEDVCRWTLDELLLLVDSACLYNTTLWGYVIVYQPY